MSDRRPHRRMPDADQVRDLLRREAASHEPDVDGILRLLGEARRHRSEPGTRRYGSRSHRGWDVPLAWATAAALLVIGVATVQRLPGEDVVSSQPPGSTSAASITSTTSTTSPGARWTRGPASGAAPTTAVTPSAPTAGTPVVRLSPSPDGTEVRLPREGDRDWVLVGSRRDGKVVRAKDGSGEIVDVSARGTAASVVPGPWRVSWTGGSPEQDHSGASTWSSVPSGSGRQQVVVRLRSPGTIDVYLGTSLPSGAAVTAWVTPPAMPPAESVSRERSVRTSVPSGGALASVQAEDAAPGSTVTITLSGGNGGELALSAIAVR